MTIWWSGQVRTHHSFFLLSRGNKSMKRKNGRTNTNNLKEPLAGPGRSGVGGYPDQQVVQPQKTLIFLLMVEYIPS